MQTMYSWIRRRSGSSNTNKPRKSINSSVSILCQVISTLLMAVATFQAMAQDVAVDAMPLRIEAYWLSQRIDDQAIVVVDARTAKEYKNNHIKGAVNIPVESTFNPPPNNHKVAPISRIQKIFGDAGITNNSWVVVYDNGEYVNAARIFWVLEVYGHKRASILDGGIKGWLASKLPVSNQNETIQPEQFLPTVIPERLSTKLSTRLAIQNDKQVLIDSRSAEEYAGKKSKTSRYGHIPTAINIPANMNYVVEGKISRLKPAEQLQSLYGEIDKSKKVITYCNRGRESALTYFILRELGYEVSAYDGSWMEWSTDQNLPIIKP